MLGSWRSCWCAQVAWEGSEGDEFCRCSKLVGVERKEEKRGGRAVWSLRERDEHVGGSSTSWRARAAKQLRGWARGGAREGGACPPCGHAGQGLAILIMTL